MRKALALFAVIGALMFASGCGDHCDSCHSDAYRRTDRAPAVAYADK